MASSKTRKRFTHLKSSATKMRKQGKTYSEIREVFPVPKGTLSLWLKNVKIPAQNREKMQQRAYRKWKKANRIFIQQVIDKARAKRDATKTKAKNQIKKISKKDLLIIGSMLYWAEGGKTKRGFLVFVNSDSKMVQVMMRFFREICLIPNKSIKARVQIYPGMNYNKILNFWTRLLKLPKQNFYPPQTQISRASSKRKVNILPYGTIRLAVYNTNNVSKVMGWIEGISEQINNAGVV